MLSRHLGNPNWRSIKFGAPTRARCRTMSLSNTLPEPAGTLSTTRVPKTPCKQRTTVYTPPAPPETPRRRKKTPNQCSTFPDQCLQGVKTRLPDNLTFDAIRTRLVEGLKLSYTPDDWQLHLMGRILAGYDSILCEGTGYGKSLIFEALALLGGKGKLVIVISPLKALERDQVSPQSIYFEMKVINTDIPGHAGTGEGT